MTLLAYSDSIYTITQLEPQKIQKQNENKAKTKKIKKSSRFVSGARLTGPKHFDFEQ